MPIYDYLCPDCGPFEARRPMSEAMTRVECAGCQVPAPRLPAAPRLNLMSANNRIAHSRNEKSAHEPGVVHRMGGHAHEHHGHDHGKQSTHAHSQSPAHSHARQPSPRPWMLGH